MSYWSIFERNLLIVGLADFAGSKFQRMANWPSFFFFFDTGWIERNRPPVSHNSPSFHFFYRSWASWPSVGTSSRQNRPIPLDSYWKLTNSSCRQQGTFFKVPGRKSLSKCWKILFFFRSYNCQSPLLTQWELLVNFREEFGGLANFVGSNSNGWQAVSIKKSKLGELNCTKRACGSPSFDQKIETGPQLAIRLNFEPSKIGQTL